MQLTGSPTRTACQRLKDWTGLSFSYANQQYSALRVSNDKVLTVTEALAGKGIVASSASGFPGGNKLTIPGTETDRILAIDVSSERTL